MTKLETIPAEEGATLLPKPKSTGIRRVVAVSAMVSFVIGVLAASVRSQERREDHRQEVQGRFQHAAVADRPDVRPRNAALAARAQEERDPFATDPVALARAA